MIPSDIDQLFLVERIHEIFHPVKPKNKTIKLLTLPDSFFFPREVCNMINITNINLDTFSELRLPNKVTNLRNIKNLSVNSISINILRLKKLKKVIFYDNSDRYVGVVNVFETKDPNFKGMIQLYSNHYPIQRKMI